MADDLIILGCDKRDGQRLGFPQHVENSGFIAPAVFSFAERCGDDAGDCVRIARKLASNRHFAVDGPLPQRLQWSKADGGGPPYSPGGGGSAGFSGCPAFHSIALRTRASTEG